ncbi:hypothetical protein G5714_024473 [Onychostoma macrolepis]|uniref:Uncharacterized protein n=1 Tax=Onychostoma macrolepis TaxID=369639 RepID=A0A7J6BMD6_9TELE|nr:hypothetical protein G5714_024473 [Onychostoma macrolepis]
MVATEQLSEGLTDRRETMEAVKLNISKSQDKVRKRKMERGQEDNFVVGDKFQRKEKKTMTFNTDHLIKYVEPEPQIPKKWIPSNSASLPSSTKGLSAPNSTSTNPRLKVLSSPRHTATQLMAPMHRLK